MLPIAGPSLPTTSESLTQALREGLAAQNLATREVSATGTWPDLDTLRLDLTGLHLTRAQHLPVAKIPTEGSFTTATFDLLAAPATFEETPVQLALNAVQAGFGFAQSADGQYLLVLTSAVHGELRLEVTRNALEDLLHSFAAGAAKKQGVDIKGTRLELTSRGPRELSFRAEVTAKMFVMNTTVTLTGDLSVDDQLNARLASLHFAGDGMIANAAAGFVRPQLDKLEGRVFPLMAFSLGAIKLRDLQLHGGDSLRLTAQFGS